MGFTRIPRLERVTAATIVPGAHKDPGKLAVAGLVLQTVTGARAQVHNARRGMATGGVSDPRTGGGRPKVEQKEGRPISLTVDLTGEMMWHFVSTLTGVVLPRVKDWRGMKAHCGDRSGNFLVGFKPDVVGTWPEIAINFDSYVAPFLLLGCY